MLLAQDNEIKYDLRSVQLAFLDTPIHRVQELDMEEEIGYLRVLNNQAVMFEEKAIWINIDMRKIPLMEDFQKIRRNVRTGSGSRIVEKSPQTSEESFFSCITTDAGDVFDDFTVPIFEKQTFSEEEFAAQILGEGGITKGEIQPILGFVQIGLSRHKLSERIHKIIWYSIIPRGLFIVFIGICITFFLTGYIVSPLRHMAGITLDIAKWNFTCSVDIHSKDEIGQLSANFNQMTRLLRELCAEKEKIMTQRPDLQRGWGKEVVDKFHDAVFAIIVWNNCSIPLPGQWSLTKISLKRSD
ncbi:MAG: HAMP domain-containing protein [Candidatus Brocadia sp.]|jgi:methyl-accepting chemotaxis protein